MCGLPSWIDMAVERAAGLSYRVTLQGRTLRYETWSETGARTTEHISPVPQAWRDFLLEMEALQLAHWSPDYTSPDAPARGMRWHIEIVAPARQINTCGTDALPAGDAFPRFCAAVQSLLGGRAFA